MKKVSLDVWIQLVGMLSVVASLVFVAIEIRQSQGIAIAGQIQARNQALMDFDLDVLTSENKTAMLLIEQYGNDLYRVNPDTLSLEERAAARLIESWRVRSVSNTFQHYESGLLPEDVWRQVERRITTRWANCYSRRLFNREYPSFRKYLKTLPQDCITEWAEE